MGVLTLRCVPNSDISGFGSAWTQQRAQEVDIILIHVAV